MRVSRVVAVVAVVCAAAAAAAENPGGAPPSVATLTGFGAAKFGSSIEEVRVAWPAMRPISDTEKMPSAAFTSPHLERFLVKDYTLAGLGSPVDVEFRFWKGRLWAFLVYFKDTDTEAALQYLEKSYGKHTTGSDDRPIWRGDAVTLQSMSSAGWFGATDNALSEEARTWFFKALTGKAEDAGATPAPTVAASAVPTQAAAQTPVPSPASP